MTKKESILLTNEVRNINCVVFQLGSNSNDQDAPFLTRKAFCNIKRLDLLREADHMTLGQFKAIFEKVGPLFRSKKIIHDNIKNAIIKCRESLK